MSKRNCPICGKDNKTVLHRQKLAPSETTIIGSYDVVVCLDCGFAFADDLPPQEDFNAYYSELSKYEYDYTNESHQEKIYEFLRPYCKDKNMKILDIGCSTGGLLKQFKDNGYKDLIGLDPSIKCVEIVNSRGIPCWHKNLYELEADQCFDLIILSSVLEHLVDLHGAMKKIKSLLKPYGRLFVEVPNCTRFHHNIISPFQQFSTEHINYFSHTSLRNLLEIYNFRKVTLENTTNRTTQMCDPCIFWLAFNDQATILKDVNSLENLEKYVKKSFEARDKTQTRLSKVIKDKKFIVWGTGTHTLMLLNNGLNINDIEFFIDSNKNYWGSKVRGVEIKEPNEVFKYQNPILISSWSYQNEIYDYIKKLGINNEVVKLYD